MAADVERLRRAYAAGVEGWETWVDELVHPDLEFRATGRLPDAGTVTGREGLKRWLADLREAFDEFRSEPEELTEVGDYVVAVVRQRARGRLSGLVLDQRLVFAHEIRDGRVIWMSAYRDKEAALKAIAARARQPGKEPA